MGNNEDLRNVIYYSGLFDKGFGEHFYACLYDLKTKKELILLSNDTGIFDVCRGINSRTFLTLEKDSISGKNKYFIREKDRDWCDRSYSSLEKICSLKANEYGLYKYWVGENLFSKDIKKYFGQDYVLTGVAEISPGEDVFSAYEKNHTRNILFKYKSQNIEILLEENGIINAIDNYNRKLIYGGNFTKGNENHPLVLYDPKRDISEILSEENGEIKSIHRHYNNYILYAGNFTKDNKEGSALTIINPETKEYQVVKRENGIFNSAKFSLIEVPDEFFNIGYRFL